MKAHHWILLGVVLVIGYLIGAKWPATAGRVGIAPSA